MNITITRDRSGIIWNTTLPDQQLPTNWQDHRIFIIFRHFQDTCTVFVVLMGMFGLSTNMCNLIVFRRIGFDESINVTFFGISMADFVCCLTAMISTIAMHPNVNNFMILKLSIHIEAVSVMTVEEIMSVGHNMSSIITAFAALQRCLSVTIPIKVKFLFSATRAKTFIFVVGLLAVAGRTERFITYNLGWEYNPTYNKSVFTRILVSPKNNNIFMMQNVLTISIISALTVSTIVLCISLTMKSKWRKRFSTSGSAESAINTSSKERKAVITIVLICVLYVGCSLPVLVLTVLVMKDEIFASLGHDLVSTVVFYYLWSACLLCQMINMSMNFFIYYNTSSKFYSTFKEVFVETKTADKPVH